MISFFLFEREARECVRCQTIQTRRTIAVVVFSPTFCVITVTLLFFFALRVCAMSNDSEKKDDSSGRMNSMDGNENVLLDGQLEKMGRFIWTSRKCVLKQDTFTYVSNRKPVRRRYVDLYKNHQFSFISHINSI